MHNLQSGSSELQSLDTQQGRALKLTHTLHVKAERGDSIAEAAAEGLMEIFGADACEITSFVRVPWMDHPKLVPHAIIGWQEDGGVLSPAGILAQRQEAGAGGSDGGVDLTGTANTAGACWTEHLDESSKPKSEQYEKSLQPMGLRWCLMSTHRVPQPDEGMGFVRLWRRAEAASFQAEDVNFMQKLHAMLGPWLWDRLVGQLSRLSQQPAIVTAIQKLTPAQRGVLCHLLEGGTEVEIAKRIFRSRYTVHDHVRAIYAALGVKNRVDLVLKLTRADPQIRVNGAITGHVPVVVSPD